MTWIVLFIAMLVILASQYATASVWAIAIGLFLIFLSTLSNVSVPSLVIFWTFYCPIVILINSARLRTTFLTRPILKIFRDSMPRMSRTEREALEAGGIGWEGELFSGHPDWSRLHSIPMLKLTEEEQNFLDGPVETLCANIDDWKFTHQLTDLPEEMWDFLKKEGFFGFIIPKEYGGKAFSAWAIASVLCKVYSRSIGVASTIAVPNSLGPAELLMKYGTEEQKKYYLPRLAIGEEVPCFALTSPGAGSDAAALSDVGVVCQKTISGKNVTGIQLNWNKRYITLAPVATVLGLAFRLFDPQHLLGDVDDIGITCALIPTKTKGVTVGRRHFPLNTCFMNGPTQGRDVFIPLDWIIGGVAMAGNGWRMLMECLSAGRAITLPSGAVGGSRATVMATSAYARVRKQFDVPIGRFEGIQEPLARLAGRTYMADALLRLTIAAIDFGETPTVGSAITKYHATELSRKIGNDAMDIHGGKGICLGPNNTLGRAYQGIPVAITVEGANILTRSLIIFGQGAIRCHPQLLSEMIAARQGHLQVFDKHFFAHIRHILCTGINAFWRGLTGGFLIAKPQFPHVAEVSRYYQLFSRYSTTFALIAEICILSLGASLKRREKISGRLGDVLSYLYMGSAVLKRFKDEGEHLEDLPLVHWSCKELLFGIQEALATTIRNFPNKPLKLLLWILCFPLGKHYSAPSDDLDKTIARLLMTDSPSRKRLIAGLPEAVGKNDPYAHLQDAFLKVIAVKDLEKRLMASEKKHEFVPGLTMTETISAAFTAGIINEDERIQLLQADEARQIVIAVDDFDDSELRREG